jgi:hypothetical protein
MGSRHRSVSGFFGCETGVPIPFVITLVATLGELGRATVGTGITRVFASSGDSAAEPG